MKSDLGFEGPVVNLLLKFLVCMDNLNFVTNSRNCFPNHISSPNQLSRNGQQ